jgi:hypothetical protein
MPPRHSDPSDDYTSPTLDRVPHPAEVWLRLGWRIFITPGRLILRFQYLFPKAGNVFGSARRVDDPVMHLLYAAGFWIFATAFVADSLFGDRRPMSQPSGSAAPLRPIPAVGR